MSGAYGAQWLRGIQAELDAFDKTGAFKLVPRPTDGSNVVKGKWVFRLKAQAAGLPPKFKARYVAKGFSQKEGIDFFQTYAPTAKLVTFRTLLHIAAVQDMHIHQMDVSTAFLQGDLKERIYLEAPEGSSTDPNLVWELQRPVYGLKQAPREWHAKLKAELQDMGFQPSASDPSLFIRSSSPGFFILVYVDDLTLAAHNLDELAAFKKELQSRFDMKDLGELTHYLGMDITRDREARTIILSQAPYIEGVLERFGMEDSAPVHTPMLERHGLSAPAAPPTYSSDQPYPELIGSLMYAMTCTRPDLAYPLSVLSRYVAPGRHTEEHWCAAKRLLRYLKQTKDLGLTLGGQHIQLQGYSDSSWADSQEDRRSSQGYGFHLGSGLISWRSTRSSSVALSSCEAELYAGTMAAQECIWLCKLLTELGHPQPTPTLWCDNQSTIALTENPVFHSRTKHIELRYFFIRDCVQEGKLVAKYMSSADNLADIFIKSLRKDQHSKLLYKMGLHPSMHIPE